MSDLIDRQKAIDALRAMQTYKLSEGDDMLLIDQAEAQTELMMLPSEEPGQGWIPCSERLPETTDPVIITWVNHKPEWYYEHIKDKPFVATGHYYNGRWYWFSDVCQDYLNEYGDCEMDRIYSDVEVIAWMPLPKPYERSKDGGGG